MSGGSVRERVLDLLGRIDETNPSLRIFTTASRDEALAAADSADGRRRSGRSLGALDGKCVAIKDNIDVRGMPTSAGTGHYRDAIARSDAAVVRRLRDAGAVILGKTNMHEAALGASGDNPWFGQCQNPRYPGFSCGGSSGGSAAAVAGGLADIALGTDTMGSIRVPASYCGVVGFKPGRGVLDMQGIVPLASSLDVAGVFGASLADVRDAWPVLTGSKGLDGAVALAGVRVGVPAGLLGVEADEAVVRTHSRCLTIAASAGMVTVPLEAEGWDAKRLRMQSFLLCEIEGARVYGDVIAANPAGFSEGLRKMLAFGAAQADGKEPAVRAFVEAVAGQVRNWFAHADVVLLPSTPQPAFPQEGPAPQTIADFLLPASLAGLPSISLPQGTAADGRALGVQLVAAAGRDDWLLAVAAAMEAEFNRSGDA